MTERTDVIVVGGGQAGLALSWHLRQRGIDHLVLERARIGETWRTKRWDTFCLVTPNWTVQLPGFSYAGPDPDGFLERDEIVDYLEQYATSASLPVRCGVEVTSISRGEDDAGYVVQTGDAILRAPNVVVATGAFQQPKIPSLAEHLSCDIYQLHTSDYRNPASLPDGAVLVVGTGQSGCQIAEELWQSGRQVYLSVGSCPRASRRYRGLDVSFWLQALGRYDDTVDTLPSPQARFACNPHVSGRDGGHDLNLWQFARDGIVLLGRLERAYGKTVGIARDLEANLRKADEGDATFRRAVNEYVQRTGMDAREDDSGDGSLRMDRLESASIRELDLRSAGVSTVIWASGYRPDFGWVDVPVFGDDGYPIHCRGVTACAGLFFLGLHWLYKRKSALLIGIGEDAAYLASVIAV